MPKTKVLVIEPGGMQTVLTVESLEDMQAIVGGWIEVIPMKSCDLYVEEDGIAKDLDVNPVATRFAKRELAKTGQVLLAADGWILGTAFVAGKCDPDGEMTDCPWYVLPEA